MNESQYDRLLRIRTEGVREWAFQSDHYNRYEATPYLALEELAERYFFQSTDHLIDYGCGKGRLAFFLHYRFQMSVTGIEMNGPLYEMAHENLVSYRMKHKYKRGIIRFEQMLAERYVIEPTANRFYFFNPFSVILFQQVIHRVLQSIQAHPRSVDVILYYPTIEYLLHLEDRTPFTFLQEIRVPRLYEQCNDERFVIYRLE